MGGLNWHIFFMSEQRQTPLSNTPSLLGVGNLRGERTQVRRQQTQPMVTFAPDQYAKDRKAALRRVRDASPNERLKDMLCTVTKLQEGLKRMHQKGGHHSSDPYLQSTNLNFGSQQPLDSHTEQKRLQIQKQARQYLNDFQHLAAESQFSPESRQSSNLGSSFEALQIRRRGQINRHQLCQQEQLSEEEKLALCRVKLNNQSENEFSQSRTTPIEMQASNKSRSSQLSNKRSKKEQPHVKNGLVVFPEKKDFEAEVVPSLVRNKSEKIQAIDQLDEDSSSQTHYNLPVNLDYLNQKQKEDLATRLWNELSHIAQGKFDLGLAPLAEPMLLDRQEEGDMPIDHKDQIHILTPPGEDLGHYSNVTDPIDLVVSPIQKSSARVTSNVSRRVSNCTSYEEFYEFERMQRGDNPVVEREYDEEVEGEEYASESSEHHSDTQHDEITSACRFLQTKATRKTINKQIKNDVYETKEIIDRVEIQKPVQCEEGEEVQSAYDVGGGGILHSSHTRLADSPKRSYVMVPPRQRNHYPTSTEEKIKKVQVDIRDAKGKAGIVELVASWRENEKFKREQEILEDRKFTFQTQANNMKKVESLSPVHSRGSMRSGRVLSASSEKKSKQSPIPEVKKVAFSQLSEAKSETHENQQNQTNQESFIESPKREESLETSEKSVKITNKLSVREMNEDQINGKEATNSANMLQSSSIHQENKLAYIPNTISPVNLGTTFSPQSAMVKQISPKKDNFTESFCKPDAGQKKARPQSGILVNTELKAPPTEQETSEETLVKKRDAQSMKESSNPYGSAPKQFTASASLQPAPKSILITAKSRQFQKQGSQKHSSFADQQNEDEIIKQDMSQDQTDPTELDAFSQPKIIIGSNNVVEYSYQEGASLQNPDTIVHTASNSALITALNSKKVSKDQQQIPERRNSDFEYKCAPTASYQHSGYIKQEDQAEDSCYNLPGTHHFPRNGPSPIASQVQIPLNGLSEGDADNINEPSAIMENYPRVNQTPAFEQHDQTDVWHGHGHQQQQRQRNQAATHVSNKDMKGHTNRESQDGGMFGVATYDSHADMKGKDSSAGKERAVTFTDKDKTQDQSSFINSEGPTSPIKNDQNALGTTTGNLTQEISKAIDYPFWSNEPHLIHTEEPHAFSKSDQNPDSEDRSRNADVFSRESRSDEKVRENLRVEAALHKDWKEPRKLKSLAELRVELQEFVEMQEGYEQQQPAAMSEKESIQQSKEEILASKNINQLTMRIRKYWDAQEEASYWCPDERLDLQQALEEHRRVTKQYSECWTPRRLSKQDHVASRGKGSAQFLGQIYNQEIPIRSVKNGDRRSRYYSVNDPQNPMRQRRLRSSNSIRENSNIHPQYQMQNFDRLQIQNRMQYPSQIDQLNAVKRRNIKSGADLALQYGRMNQQPEDHVLATSTDQQYLTRGGDAASSQGSIERSLPRTQTKGKLYNGQLVSVTPAPYEALLGAPKQPRQLLWAKTKVDRHQTPEFIAARSATNAQRRQSAVHTLKTLESEYQNQQNSYNLNQVTQPSSFSQHYQQFKKQTFCQGHQTSQNTQSVPRTRAATTKNFQTTDQSLLMYSRVQNMGVDIDTLPMGNLQQHRQQQNRGTISIQATHARIFNKTKGQNCLVKKGSGQIQQPLLGRRRTRQVQLFI